MKKVTFLEAQKRFSDQGREDIELLEEGYLSWKRDKACFLDKILQETFLATPKQVYDQRQVHPKRAIGLRQETNLLKYGHVNPLHGNTPEALKVQEKRLATCQKKYGTDWSSQSEDIKQKVILSSRRNYGVDNISQSKEIQAKKEETSLRNRGVAFPAQDASIREKMSETNLIRHGVAFASQNESIKTKIRSTLIEKYGVQSPFQLPGVAGKSAKTIYETRSLKLSDSELTVQDWYELLSLERKPSYSYFLSLIEDKTHITTGLLEQLVANYTNHKSGLEVLAEKLLGCKVYNRKAIAEIPFKPDFKLSETMFVNVDGLYWHSEKNKPKTYHLELREEFEVHGLSILQIREDELRNQPTIVKSILDAKLGLISKKVFARSTIVKEVNSSEAKEFLAKNHLMGSIDAKCHLGLYLKNANTLVSLLSYKLYKDQTVCKVERFCSLINMIVVGGLSKLLSKIGELESSVKEIHYWVDCRYGNGVPLERFGFLKIKETLGWKWTEGVNTFNRLRCRANMDARCLTEKEHAQELGWYKIYDAGQRLYVCKLLTPS